MNVKTWIPLILAVVLGTVALVVARKALRPAGPQTAQVRTSEVVVASRDVAVGRELTAEDLAVSRVLPENVPSGSFAKPQELVGRAATTPIVKGQAVLETLLAPEGSGAGLQAMVPPGMRAITLEVNEITGVAGMLPPGARVDVICTVRDEKSQQPLARTILQNIRVLASGRQLSHAPPSEPANGQQQPAPPPASNVTLLVTQRQAQALQLAAQGSRPWLVLRSPRDDDDEQPEATRMADLRGEGEEEYYGPLVTATPTPPQPSTVVAVAPTSQPTTAPSAAPRRVWVMRVIRGGTVTEMAFPAPPPKTPAVQDPGLQLQPQPQPPAVTGAGGDLQEEAQ